MAAMLAHAPIVLLGWHSTLQGECLVQYGVARTRCASEALSRRRQCDASASPPRVAFIVAGDVRSFAEAEFYLSFHRHVMQSFAAHRASRLFMVLRNAAQLDLGPLLKVLAPAMLLVDDSTDDVPPRGLPFRNAACQSKWARGASRLARTAVVWWSAMNAAWHLVEQYEQSQLPAHRFSMVVFARPDMRYSHAMGPWCGYQNGTWYSSDPLIAPDMFWVVPRHAAALVLRDTLTVAIECDTGQPCCNATEVQSRSHFPTQYWPSVARVAPIEWGALLGSAMVARRPRGGTVEQRRASREARRAIGDAANREQRDCTLHVGCWPAKQGSTDCSARTELRPKGVCSTYSGQPELCTRHRVGASPCRHFAQGMCRRDFDPASRCNETSMREP